MKKSKILGVVMLLAIFASAFSVATYTTSPARFVGAQEAPSLTEPSVMVPEKMSYDNGTWAQVTAQTIVLDGNVSEWTDVIPETFGGATVYLAYDATNVYVAVVWADSTVGTQGSQWNKTDATDGFEMIDGDDDVVTVGFSLDGQSDMWTWTASNRTSNDYALEWNATSGEFDAGTLPFVKNALDGDFANGYPIYDNNWDPILDNSTIAVNTHINAWQVNETTPTGDQTSVDIGVNHTGTHYIVEFMRPLIAADADDFTFDFTGNDMYFHVGVANGDGAVDFGIATSSHLICLTNEPGEITLDPVPELVNGSLLLQGTAYDDYEDYFVEVWVDTWADTWGSVDYVDVNRVTGAWSYLLLFNEMDMPLGDAEITISLYAPYEGYHDAVDESYFQDIEAPSIVGLTNLTYRYPTGVQCADEYVTVTVGLSDNYDYVDYLTANVYTIVDDGIALATPMVQFYADTTSFNANITLDPTWDCSVQHNITYFVQAWDTTGNKRTSERYTFFTAITLKTPGFGIIAGLFGVAAAVFIVKKLKK
jgi:hypothetical protein